MIAIKEPDDDGQLSVPFKILACYLAALTVVVVVLFLSGGSLLWTVVAVLGIGTVSAAIAFRRR